MTRIAHISDLHFGALEPGAVRALTTALADAAPTVIALSGDLTMRGRVREFRQASAFVESLGAPVVATAGNHDVPAYNPLARFTRPTGRFRAAMQGVAMSAFAGNDLTLVAANSARAWTAHWNWAHGAFSRAQIRRADAALAGDPDPARWRGLVTHHPFEVPREMRSMRPVGKAASMLGVIAKRGVDFVLAGHLHHASWSFSAHAERALGRSVLLIQASTATSSRRRDQPNAFNVIDLGPSELRLTPWTLEGGAFGPGETIVFERSERGPTRTPQASRP